MLGRSHRSSTIWGVWTSWAVGAFSTFMVLGLILSLGFACRPVQADCSNGDCVCEVGASCDFECEAPPCHVDCAGDNPECVAACGNGDCRCGAGSTCTFECQSPPCHVDCEAQTECRGTCANGDCTCVAGSRCDFACDAGPCHVTCEGGHDLCAGVCANGTCRCGVDSRCDFECMDANCPVVCEAGSICTLRCPGGQIGQQGCRFDTCAAGEPTRCEGREGEEPALVCGAGCEVLAES
ncbi:MAG: hypothetical protein AAGF11_07890 [Myxococcota bacterium]